MTINDNQKQPFYGGLSGAQIDVERFVITDGILIRKTFAHVFAAYMVALKPPEKPCKHHPAPWYPTDRGLSFDVEVEIGISRDFPELGFDRLNSLWFVSALLRLITGGPFRMPVAADMSFKGIEHSDAKPKLFSLEVQPEQLRTVLDPSSRIELRTLEWLAKYYVGAAKLMKNPDFNRAFQTFDSAIWAHSAGASIVMLWAALEALMRPGRKGISKKLALLTATFLHNSKSERDKRFQDVRRLYEARGTVVHNSSEIEATEYFDTWRLVREVITRCIELNRIPNSGELLADWKDTHI